MSMLSIIVIVEKGMRIVCLSRQWTLVLPFYHVVDWLTSYRLLSLARLPLYTQTCNTATIPMLYVLKCSLFYCITVHCIVVMLLSRNYYQVGAYPGCDLTDTWTSSLQYQSLDHSSTNLGQSSC